MRKLLINIGILILLVPLTSIAQEVLMPLNYNPNLRVNTHKKANIQSALQKDTVLYLPFFDDFSDSYIYPKSSLWIDSSVYINSNYSNDPISIGVATFDALDKNGELYGQADSVTTFLADQLTSRPIDLDSCSINDSIYLSFFYQSGGLGEKPDNTDSLILYFYAPLQKKWITIWKVPGNSAYSPFKLAIIPIYDTAYFHNKFQFRFANYVSINIINNETGKNSNGDIWNLDYIYLNKRRGDFDTVFHDLAIMRPLKSPLKNFESIPQNHFKLPSVYEKEMGGQLTLYIRNNDSIIRNTQRSYLITDVYKKQSFVPFSPAAIDAPRETVVSFKDDMIDISLVSDMDDSGLFKITARLDKTLASEPKSNDTTVYYQVFRNYYAYDDGSAELGYGFQGEGTSNACLAYKFATYSGFLTVPDSLQAIDIFFNRSVKNESQQPFSLTIWDDNKGIPGKKIYNEKVYKDSSYKPEFEEGYNHFHRYFLENAIAVPATFYVGWIQTTETFLNVGFDMNRIKTDTIIFYNLQDTHDNSNAWTPSTQKGALMIRPIMGNWKEAHTGVKTFKTVKFELYPNPAFDNINIKMPDKSSVSGINLSVYNLTGQLVLKNQAFYQGINISRLSPGMYIMTIVTDKGQMYTSKFIKSAH